MSCTHKVSFLILILKNIEKVEKVEKNDERITLKAPAHLQTMTKTPAKFQKVWYKTVRGVAPTSHSCHPVTTKQN